MIVTRQNFGGVFLELATVQELACDTETTGLRPYGKDVPFAVILASQDHEWYFNLNDYQELDPDLRLTGEELSPIFSVRRRWIFHNAKFDQAMLAKIGCFPLGDVYDVKIMGRLLKNDEYAYDLDSMAKRHLGQAKDDGVGRYIAAQKLYDAEKQPQYQLVPLEVMQPYGEKDARLTFDLYRQLSAEIPAFELMNYPAHLTRLSHLHGHERELLQAVRRMEDRGVLLDREFCHRALRHEQLRGEVSRAMFQELTGHEYLASGKLFAEIFAGEELKQTKKGNPSFDASAMATYIHPAAAIVTDIKEAKGRCDVYQALLEHSFYDGAVHAIFDQAGTATGRFSSSKPNLQNLEKPEKGAVEAFTPRRAIIPRPGFFFAMFDMNQAEYRLMLEYAGATALIKKVLEGLDVHSATALLAAITRDQAKTTNFAVIYGSGDRTLAKTLKTSVAEARRIKRAIYAAAPEVERFITQVVETATKRGFVINWAGRLIRCGDTRFAYTIPNHLIQGGVGEIVKRGMVSTDHYLEGHGAKSRLVLNIHDELVFEMANDEAHLLPALHAILEGTYPHKRLPLTWGVDHSFKSLADKVEGAPPCRPETASQSPKSHASQASPL